MTDVNEILRQALEKLAAGEREAVRNLMGKPYKEAYAGADEASQKTAKKLHEQLHNAMREEAKHHIQPHAKEALKAFCEHDMAAATKALHDAMHDIDIVRSRQAAALTQQEAALYEEKGMLGYAWDLIRRRWGKAQEAAPGHAEAHHAHGGGHECSHGGHPGEHGEHHHQATPKEVSNIAADGKALEEYAGIRHLDSAGKKFLLGAGATVGMGLVLHGSYNTAKSFGKGEEKDASQRQVSGMNWTRLVVGVGEMAAGAALVYRMLTGRWGLRGPVKGVADPIMQCEHGHGH